MCHSLDTYVNGCYLPLDFLILRALAQLAGGRVESGNCIFWLLLKCVFFKCYVGQSVVGYSSSGSCQILLHISSFC